MGGAAGHIQHVWEVEKFNFYDISNIIKNSFSGNLDNVTEKLDGQNFMMTFRDGRFRGARTGKHRRNFGKDGLVVETIKDYFSPNTPDIIKESFALVMNQFEKMVFIKQPLDIMFKNGKYWINMEILYEPTENVAHYGKNQIRIHNMMEVDENGKIIKTIDKDISYLTILNNGRDFDIEKTNKVILKPMDDKIIKDYTDKLQYLWRSRGLTGNNTISDFIAEETRRYLTTIGVSDHIFSDLPNDLIKELIKRWGRKDKSTTITKLLKDKEEKVINWVKIMDKTMELNRKSFFNPLIELISSFGVRVLKNLKGLTTDNKKESIKRMKLRAKEARIYAEDHLKDLDEKTIMKLDSSLSLFKYLGGLNSITPAEGIVFDYSGEKLKLTGSFTPLIQIIGFQKYS